MQKKLVRIITHEEKEKANLQKSLQNKQKILTQWMEKVEMLRMALDLIKNEYDVRIGALLLKDNQLDLEIIKYKNLKNLMQGGMSYEEALRHEEDKFYNEILRLQKEQEQIREEEKILHSRHDISREVEENIKVLWKNLIRKFHPDLTLNESEKEKRNMLMTKINTAYRDNDLQTLQEIEHIQEIQEVKDVSLDRLKDMLILMENMIIEWKEKFVTLRASEWYSWKVRKEKQVKKAAPEDVFAQLERKLLNDIVKKIEMLNLLKREVSPQTLA